MQNSKIEWTDHTFNPWIGCTKVSLGCKNCYAENLMDKRYKRVTWGKGQPRQRTSLANWRKPYQWNRKAKKEKRQERVFCASLADVFDTEVADEWRIDLFRTIYATEHLDWLLLTKRPEEVNSFLERARWPLTGNPVCPHRVLPANVWIGTSVEDRKTMKRINDLAKIEAKIRFLSVEPLIEEVDLGLRNWAWSSYGSKPERGAEIYGDVGLPECRLDWIIVGGESGSNARPMHPDWAKLIQEDCQSAGIPFFFKQWGAWAPLIEIDSVPEIVRRALDGKVPRHDWGTGGIDVVYRVGKKKAGRLLMGETWDEVPNVRLSR